MIKGWKDITLTDFKAFLAIIITLGIVKYPTRRIAFYDPMLGSPFIQSLGISLEKFERILKAWHYEDYTDYTPAIIANNKKIDAFWPVKRLAVLLAQAFERTFNCGQLITVDEQTIPWKGKHMYKCYNKDKPEKWHLKIQSLNDAVTGYMSNFYLYQGKSEQRPERIPATEYPFHKLLENKEKWHNKNHVVVADNLFTSMGSMKFHIGTGNHHIGTVRTNRKGLPKNKIFSKQGKAKASGNNFQERKRKRGDMQQYKTTIDSHPVYLVAWQDAKPVHILSTIPTRSTTTNRTGKNSQGQYEKKIAQPSLIQLYNAGRGGTDSQDQRLSYYRPKVKTVSWIPRVLIHFFTLMIFNAFVIYKWHTKQHKKYSLLDFNKTLMMELAEDRYNELCLVEQNIGAHTQDDINDQKQVAQQGEEKEDDDDHHIMPPPPRKRMRRNWMVTDVRRLIGRHDPQKLIREDLNDKHKYERGRCALCKARVPSQCAQCGVFLCLDKTSGEFNHWMTFHNEKNLPCMKGQGTYHVHYK